LTILGLKAWARLILSQKSMRVSMMVRLFPGTGMSDNLVKKACRELDIEPDLMDTVQMLNYSVKEKQK
jgi:hypothetical protein